MFSGEQCSFLVNAASLLSADERSVRLSAVIGGSESPHLLQFQLGHGAGQVASQRCSKGREPVEQARDAGEEKP